MEKGGSRNWSPCARQHPPFSSSSSQVVQALPCFLSLSAVSGIPKTVQGTWGCLCGTLRKWLWEKKKPMSVNKCSKQSQFLFTLRFPPHPNFTVNPVCKDFVPALQTGPVPIRSNANTNQVLAL